MTAADKEKEKVAGEENMKAGAAFLHINAKKEGVGTLPSGLQYKVVKTKNGKKPVDTDTVLIIYRGMLIDGTGFDSSYRNGQQEHRPPSRTKRNPLIDQPIAEPSGRCGDDVVLSS